MTTLRQYDARWAVFGKFPLHTIYIIHIYTILRFNIEYCVLGLHHIYLIISGMVIDLKVFIVPFYYT